VSSIVLFKLLGIFAVIGVGWIAGRTRVVGPDGTAGLTRVAFGVFAPALLFRTTAGIAVGRLPWGTLAGYFGPTLALLLAVYTWQRARDAWQRTRDAEQPAPSPVPAAPAIRALSMSFSNTVQLGIPVMTALFGAAGLAVLIAIVSLQSLVLMTTATLLVELDLARAGQEITTPARAIGNTVRRAFVHPVVLPVLLGLAYNATGWPIPGPVDDVLITLGQAVVPVSLVTIGLTLNLYGVAGSVRPAVRLAAGKLLLQPAVVLAAAYWGFGLRGLPLTVAVLCAALPIGSNVLLFASRYEVLQAETTAAIVASTCGFLVTGTGWLLVLSYLTG
jgi:malonate transporter